jgi:putative oxidoreductase
MTSSTSDPSITAGDVAGVILRAALAGTMIAHGVRHARTLEGTAGWFGSIGFDKPELQAKASAAVEIGSGVALALGLATPLSASAVVGTMSVAYMSVHRPNGYFVIKEGWEYVGFISAASLAASALGGGRLSVDRLLGLHTAGTPVTRAAVTAALGVAGAAVQLALFWRSPERAPREVA